MNELVKQENVELIVREAPLSYKENQISHDRCIEFGQQILTLIQHQGMTDELDIQAAEFIDRAKKTAKKMNDKRAPITKLFDEIRSVYTAMESDIDPTKPTSIPGQLQKIRNEYAAKKRAQAEERRREEERKQRIQAAQNTYRLAVEEDLKVTFNRYLNAKLNELTELNRTITLENFSARTENIQNTPTSLSPQWESLLSSTAIRPADLDTTSARKILTDAVNTLLPNFREQFSLEMEETLNNITLILPSKKKELENIARAGAEEAARRKEEMQRRDAEEAARIQEERTRKEEEEKRAQQVKQQQNEMAGLFAQAQIATPVYQPKAQVKKKLVITDPRGFLDILNLWWTAQGCTLSIEELTRKFKSQITFCEKMANDKTPHLIHSEFISYQEDIKAK